MASPTAQWLKFFPETYFSYSKILKNSLLYASLRLTAWPAPDLIIPSVVDPSSFSHDPVMQIWTHHKTYFSCVLPKNINSGLCFYIQVLALRPTSGPPQLLVRASPRLTLLAAARALLLTEKGVGHIKMSHVNKYGSQGLKNANKDRKKYLFNSAPDFVPDKGHITVNVPKSCPHEAHFLMRKRKTITKSK